MANLPSIGRQIVTTQPGTSSISTADIVGPYSMLAGALGDISEGVENLQVKEAVREGPKAVTQQPDGTYSFDPMPDLSGRYGAAYNRSALVAATAKTESAVRAELSNKALEFDGRPDDFNKFLAGYHEQMTAGANDVLRPAVDRIVMQTGSDLLQNLRLQKYKRDTDADKKILQDQLTEFDNRASAIAFGHGTNDPRYLQTVTDANSVLNTLQSDPRFGFSKQMGEGWQKQMFDRHQAMAAVGSVRSTYLNQGADAEGRPLGGYDRAMELARSILSDDKLNLTERERQQYYHRAVGEITALDAIRRQDLQQARAARAELNMVSATGGRIEPQQVESVAEAFRAAGDPASAANVYAAYARKPLNDEFGRQPLAEQTRQLAALKGASAAQESFNFFTKEKGYSPQVAAAIVGHLVQESGIKSTARHDGGIGYGIAGWNGARLEALKQFAKEKNSDPSDFKMQLAFVDHELHTTEGAVRIRLENAKTPEEAAHIFMDYERPAGWTSQTPETGSAYSTRLALSRTIFDGKHQEAVNNPAGAAWLSINREKTLDANTWAQWQKIEKDYKEKGFRPADSVINEVVQAARVAGNATLLDTIAAGVQKMDFAQSLAQQPLPLQEAQVTELKRQGSLGQLDPGTASIVADLERRKNAIEHGIKENPVSTAVQNFPDHFKTPLPLDPQDSTGFAAGLRQRGQIAAFAANKWQTGPLSALDSADVAQVSAALNTPDVATKIRIFSAMSSALPENVLNATLAKLGEKGPGMQVNIGAAALLRQSPDIAMSIMRGHAAINSEKGLLPKGLSVGVTQGEGGGEAGTFTRDMNALLPITVFPLVSRTNPQGKLATMQGMVKARYADLSAQAGDASGKYNEGRLKQAVDDVTGGIVWHNGQALISPEHGMKQREFDGVLWGIQDNDLEGVTTQGGEKITADMLRSRARLESLQSGRYLLNLSHDPDKGPIYAITGAHTEYPQRFVLDLRNRKGAAPIGPDIGGIGNSP